MAKASIMPSTLSPITHQRMAARKPAEEKTDQALSGLAAVFCGIRRFHCLSRWLALSSSQRNPASSIRLNSSTVTRHRSNSRSCCDWATSYWAGPGLIAFGFLANSAISSPVSYGPSRAILDEFGK
jgi:hypothetical protein